MKFASRSQFSHWLTLNTHRDLSMTTAAKHLKRWRVEVLRETHGYRFFTLPDEQLTWYMGSFELSAAGHPHFHLAVVVPPSLALKFERCAIRRWDRIMRSGTSHLVPIGPTADDQRNVLGYAAKWLDPAAEVSFVHSKADL